MQASATGRFIRVSPRKTRLVADLIRGKEVPRALAILQHTPTAPAGVMEKVLRSAVANADQAGVAADDLVVGEVLVDVAPTLKRFMPRAMGRASRIRKRMSHIKVVLQEAE